MVDMDWQWAYTSSGNAGAPVCIRLYCDIWQGGTEQWTQQLTKALNLLKSKKIASISKVSSKDKLI